jgi:hypothetical protein
VVGALGILAFLIALPALGFVGIAGAFARFGNLLQQATQNARPAGDAEARAEDGLRELFRAADAYRMEHGAPPPDADALYAHWAQLHPGQEEPRDPFDGERFGYALEEEHYLLWSAGPDPESDADDIVWSGDVAP